MRKFISVDYFQRNSTAISQLTRQYFKFLYLKKTIVLEIVMVIIRSRLILLITCIKDTDRIGLHSFQLSFVIDEK